MLSVNDKLSRPRVEFTPAGYKSARKLYDRGRHGALITMLREATVDSHVAGCLVGRRAGYKRVYTLSPFDETEAHARRQQWMRSVLARLGLRDLLEAIHDARLYSFNVIDFPEWAVEDGLQLPTRFHHAGEDNGPFSHHHFRLDKRDRAFKVDRGGEQMEELPETALVVAAKRAPLMLPVLRDYILAEFGWESFAAFLEMFGEPFIIAKYPPGATDAQKAEIDEALTAMARSTRGRAPDGTTFEIHESKRGSGDHDKFLSMVHKGITISLLGHANAVEVAGGLQIGDHPVGFEVKFEIGTDDAYWIDPWVNRIIQMIYDRNWPDRLYPTFELVKERPMTRQELLNTLDRMYQWGFAVLPDMVRRLGVDLLPDEEPQRRQVLNLFD